MTLALTEDGLLEFAGLVRQMTGVSLAQTDAAVELAAIADKYAAPADADCPAAPTCA